MVGSQPRLQGATRLLRWMHYYIAVVDGSGVAEAEQQQGASRGVLQEARCEMQRHGLMASPGRLPVVPPTGTLRRSTHTKTDAQASWLSAD
jgi:hypothetical protein